MYGLLAGSNLDASSWLPFSDISQQRRVGLVWFPIVHVSIPDSFPHCPQLHHKKWLAYRCSCWDETRHLICEFREWLFDWSRILMCRLILGFVVYMAVGVAYRVSVLRVSGLEVWTSPHLVSRAIISSAKLLHWDSEFVQDMVALLISSSMARCWRMMTCFLMNASCS